MPGLDELQPLIDAASQAQKADNPAERGGPSEVAPDSGKDKSPLVVDTMTPDEVGDWWARIEASRKRREVVEGKWDILLKEYSPSVQATGSAEDVKVMAHFRNVHTKIGQLFYRTPGIVLEPRGYLKSPVPNPMFGPQNPQVPPMVDREGIIAAKQEMLNYYLGRDEINTIRLMDELLFDSLAWAGVAACKIGYTCTIKMVSLPKQGNAPGNPIGPDGRPIQIPLTDPTNPGQLLMEDVPVPIHETWYGRRMSPKKLLLDPDLKSTRYFEDSTWIGMEFFMSAKVAKSALGLTDDEVSAACAQDDRVYKHDIDSGATNKAKLVHGIEIWAKSSFFTNEVHPQGISQLVLIEGIRDRPIVWRPSPNQTFDQMGKLTPDSLLGFPIKVLTIRDFADSPYPWSDAAFTNNNVKELSTFRRQSIRMRDAAIGKYVYDESKLAEGELDRIKNGTIGDWIGLQEDALRGGIKGIIDVTPQVKASPDDYRTIAALKQEMDETLGIGSVQSGTPESTVRTATEIANVQTAVAGRNEKEQSRVVDFFLDYVRGVDSLLMRYATGPDYVHITGENGAQNMLMWSKDMIVGKWMYDIKPDSQLRLDAAKDRQQKMQLYNLIAADPLANRTPVLRDLFRSFGYDPAKSVLDPAAQMMQPQHGGPVNKHQQEQTGNRPNEPGRQGDNRDTRNTVTH